MKKFTLIAASVLMASPVLAANHSPLTLEVYNADGNSFHVNSTLVYGETDAMVIDTGFTKADAMRIAAKVLDSGKTLKTILSAKRTQTTTLAQRPYTNSSLMRRSSQRLRFKKLLKRNWLESWRTGDQSWAQTHR